MNYDDFTTKDSGEREQYASGMQRDTQSGKPRFDLLLADGVPYQAQFLTRVAALLARGAEKYSARNHERASSDEELERFVASGVRHMMQWATGETDEDHAAAVVFNLFAAESLKQRRKLAETQESVSEVLEHIDESFERFQEAVKAAADMRAQEPDEDLCSICRKPRGECRRHEPFDTPAGQTLTMNDIWPLGNITAWDLKMIYGYDSGEARDLVLGAKKLKEERDGKKT